MKPDWIDPWLIRSKNAQMPDAEVEAAKRFVQDLPRELHGQIAAFPLYCIVEATCETHGAHYGIVGGYASGRLRVFEDPKFTGSFDVDAADCCVIGYFGALTPDLIRYWLMIAEA